MMNCCIRDAILFCAEVHSELNNNDFSANGFFPRIRKLPWKIYIGNTFLWPYSFMLNPKKQWNLWFLMHLNDYLPLHVCLSFHTWVCKWVHHTLEISVASQNVTNKSFFVSVQSEKYVFWVTLRHLESKRQGKAVLRTLLGKGKPSYMY